MPPGGSGMTPAPPILPATGMRPPSSGIMSNANNNFTNHQQISTGQQQQPVTNNMNTNGKTDEADENDMNDEGSDDKSSDKKPAEVILPKALEDVLALKDQRAAEYDVNTDDFSQADASGQLVNDYDAGEDSDEEGDNQINGGMDTKPEKLSKVEKNKKKKRRKKLNKKLKKQQEQTRADDYAKDGETVEDTEETEVESKGREEETSKANNNKSELDKESETLTDNDVSIE